jgi:hypothetical protein
MSNVYKILFRRGSDSQRQTVILNAGEPGYSLDTKRLFVGDGSTFGGNPVGAVNYGIVSALSGNYIVNSIQTNLSRAAFSLLSAAYIGDFVYDQNTTSLWAVTGTSVIATGTDVPLLSNFAHLYSTTNFNASQFYYNGSQLTIKNGTNGQGYGVGINELNASVTAGSPTLSGGSGNILNIKTNGITNTFLKPGAANSVKITNNTGVGIDDIAIGGYNQFLGYTSIGTALGAVTLSATGGTTVVAEASKLTFKTPICISQSGGTLTGTLSATVADGGRLVTDVTPTNNNDVVNLAFVRSTSAITVDLLSKYLPLSGGTVTGDLTLNKNLYINNSNYGAIQLGNNIINQGFIITKESSDNTFNVQTNVLGSSTSRLNIDQSGNVTLAQNGGTVNIGAKQTSNKFYVKRSAGTNSIADIYATDGTQWIHLNSNEAIGAWNPLVQNNDASIMYSGGGIDASTSGIVIGPHSSTAKGIRINNSGYVGIGVTAPVRPLEVNNALKLTNTSTDSNDGVIGTATFVPGLNIVGINTDSTNRKIAYYGALQQQDTATNYFQGKVGIGLTAPNTTLTINGQVSATQFYAKLSPTATNELTRKDYVDSLTTQATPPGTVAFLATTTAPTGWIKANGAVLRQADYPALFAVLPKQTNGQTIWWQSTDGPSNFRIPDLRGQFIRGWNDGIGAVNYGTTPPSTLPIPTTDAGRSFGVTQVDAFKNHQHKFGADDQIMSQGGYTRIDSFPYDASSTTSGGGGGARTKDDSTNFGDTETRPTNVNLLACIKY